VKGKYKGLLDLLSDDGLTFRERMANMSPEQLRKVLARRAPFVEEYFTMVGHNEGGLYTASVIDHQTQNNPGMVQFDPETVLRRHLSHNDVIGWFHTHPPGVWDMSPMDIRCFTSWLLALTNPAAPVPRYAVILCSGILRAWRLTLNGLELRYELTPVSYSPEGDKILIME